jgi:amino acid adenylation domain-containing protein/thioester reductase-like protein
VYSVKKGHICSTEIPRRVLVLQSVPRNNWVNTSYIGPEPVVNGSSHCDFDIYSKGISSGEREELEIYSTKTKFHLLAVTLYSFNVDIHGKNPSIAMTQAEEYDLAVCRNKGLGQLFYHQVQRDPNAIAIVNGKTSLTYKQLHCQALYIAHQLSQECLIIEEPVGIVVQHGISDVVAQLAIIYAGGSCATIDPTLPDSQIWDRLQRLNTRYILVDKENKARDLPFLAVIVEGYSTNHSPETYPIATDLEHRTHLIHTSGTTNAPKAVQISARSILQVVFHAPFEPVRASDVVAHVNNSSFDVSLFDIWAPLLRGARIVVLDKTVLLDLPVMAEHINRFGITVMATTTALLNLAAATYPRAFAKLRVCFIGGEAANVGAIETIFNQGPPEMLINAYGPTECCVFCLAHCVTRKDVQAGSVSIGTPIGRTIAYIADDTGRESDEGELWIGGAGVTRGYFNQPDQNAAAFTTIDGLVTASGEPVRLYRTGDIVSRRSDGQIDYIGRRDHQVKVRGFRIELGVVETALLNIGRFTEAVAMKIDHPQEGAGSMLVAYAVPIDEPHSSEIGNAVEVLKKILPGYMIPQIELIAKMPLNNHDKVDRKKLTELYCQRWKNLSPIEPQYASKNTRSSLAQIWASILSCHSTPYGDTDDFFLLGGSSFHASMLIAQIRRIFGSQISLLALYDNSTLGSLTCLIQNSHGRQLETVRNESNIWIADTKIADNLECPQSPPVDWTLNTEGRVFLTGATGFVGAFMLAELLRLTHVRQVGCLVRAAHATVALQRLRDAIAKYDLWEDSFEAKLLVFPGLLEDEHLGLGQEHFHEMANWASVVFHLGARVNYTQPYSLHRPANTLGTLNVIRFACSGRTKGLHYISSISCFGPTGFVTGASVVEENESLLPHIEALNYDHGYAQSQWVVEQLIRRLLDRNFPIAVYRPGFITGHSETGACNPDDFFSRLILACREMGAYPQLPNQRKEFVPVDYVNSVILHIAKSLPSLGNVYHIVPPSRGLSIDMDATMALIGEAGGSPIRGMPYAEWIDLLAVNTPHGLQPLQPMLAEKVQGGMTRWELYENMPIYDTKNTANALADYSGGLEFPVLGYSMMKKYLDYLQK